MDSITPKLMEGIKKYRYALLVLMLGIILMNLSIPERTAVNPESQDDPPQKADSISQELESMLGQISGAGKVKVMLTLAAGPITRYQEDREENNSEQSGTKRFTTVTVSGTGQGQTGLVQQIIPETFRGAAVLCQGADSPQVRLAILEAVSRTTGLGTDRICVLKMK